MLMKQLWSAYVFNKQTMRELAEEHQMDKRTIRALLFQYRPPQKVHHPRPIHLVVDATYFGERQEGCYWCVLVARDPLNKEDLVWLFTDTETTSAYRQLRDELEQLGYTIQSVTGDGFTAIKSAFSGIPYQMCHVHMERLVTIGTTRDPQTEAGKVLLALVKTLHITNSHLFYTRLQKYIEYFRDFLNEKSAHPVTGELDWTHRPLRSAVLSLERFKKYLFTFEHDQYIQKTTNSLEGHFSHINTLMSVHRGITKEHAQYLLHSIFLASTIAPTQKKIQDIL